MLRISVEKQMGHGRFEKLKKVRRAYEGNTGVDVNGREAGTRSLCRSRSLNFRGRWPAEPFVF